MHQSLKGKILRYPRALLSLLFIANCCNKQCSWVAKSYGCNFGYSKLNCSFLTFGLMYGLGHRLCTANVMPSQKGDQNRGHQGLGLAWILKNRKRWQQWWLAADVATTLVSLLDKNMPWQPCNKMRFTKNPCLPKFMVGVAF